MKLSLGFLIPLMFSLAASADARSDSFRDALGPRFNSAQSIRKNEAPKKDLDSIHRWNQIAIDASGLDHTPVAPGENRVFGEQLGPGRSSRAMAIVHIAIFDVVNALAEGEYKSYTGVEAPRGLVSFNAAVSQTAHDTLAALYPSQ